MSSDNIISRFTQSLEGLPRMIANSLSSRGDDFKKRAEKVIDDIVKDFDVEGTIREVAEPLLTSALASAIKNHFESTSGKEAIKTHIENILKDVTSLEDKSTEVTEKPAATATVSSKSDTFVPPPGTMLFADPLTLSEIKELQPGLTPILDFTLDGFKHALDEFNTNNPQATHPVLILNKLDAPRMQLPPFDNFFDPITEAGRRTQGQIGHILNMEAYSDIATGQIPFINTSGFLNKPVELEHATATNQTMAEVKAS